MTTPDITGDRYDFARFSLSDMIRCGRELRKLGTTASSMEEEANRMASVNAKLAILPFAGDRIFA